MGSDIFGALFSQVDTLGTTAVQSIFLRHIASVDDAIPCGWVRTAANASLNAQAMQELAGQSKATQIMTYDAAKATLVGP